MHGESAPDRNQTRVDHRRPSWGLALPAGAGLLLWLASLLQFVDRMHNPVSTFDEGILLTDASLLSAGQAIYRDFYSCYPPGIFLVLAAIWKVAGVSVLSERFLGLFVHLGIALLVGRLAGRLVSRTFLFWPAGVCGAWMVALAPSPFAYLAALACALLSVELAAWALTRPGPEAWLAPGFAFGCVACLRHDLFVYNSAALVPVAALFVWQARPPLSVVRPRAVWAAMGLLASLLPIWLPLIWRAGLTQPFHDLFLDQIRYVMPGRALPLPAMWEPVHVSPLPFALPAWWASLFPAAVALGFAGPLLGILMIVFSRRLQIQNRLLVALLTALSLAVLPQMLGRTDIWHALYIVGPALVLVGALAEALGPARGWRWLISAALLILPVRDLFIPPGESPETETIDSRYKGLPRLGPDERALVAFVQSRVPPGLPIYVGLTDHRRVFVSEMDLYFLIDRPGATRIMQFEPNVVEREETQREMAREIDARATLLILSSRFLSVPERKETPEGSGYLDAFIRQHFALAESFGPYQVWLPQRDKLSGAR